MKSLYISLLFFIVATLNACSPRDVHVKNLKQRLLDGEVVMFDKSGERAPTCLDYDSDWSDLRIHESDYEPFIVHSKTSLVKNGYKNCHRVGSRVFIENDRIQSNGSLGFAEITGIALMSVDQLAKERNLVANNKVLEANYDSTVERITQRVQPRDQGIVHVTFVKYIHGTSSLEKSFLEKIEQQGALEEEVVAGKIINLSKEGDRLSTCTGALWTDFRVRSQIYEDVKVGQVKTILKGSQNCHQVGQLIPINSKDLEGDLGKVKITGLTLLSLDSLKKNKDLVKGDAAQASLASDINYYEGKLKDQGNKILSLIHFEYVGGQ